MKEEMFEMYMNSSGEWEKYDNTYDITIHCKTKEDQDNAIEVIRRANRVMEEDERELKEYRDTGLTPEKLRFIDSEYTRLCKENAELKKRLETENAR